MMECHQTDQRFHSLGQAQGLSQQNDMSKWKEMGKHIKERNDNGKSRASGAVHRKPSDT